MTVPCGQCIGCRLEKSRQWAVRMMHEAQLHERNSFVTLTYSPEELPSYGSLRKEDFQKFMKRLRREIEPRKVRFFHCGEYGEAFSRPHYHACLFGVDFGGDRFEHTVRDSVPVWRSPTLERLWPYGFSEIGQLTYGSARYVARYVHKKIGGSAAGDHYSVVDAETGEVVQLEPEYATMSRRPGIGAGWFEKFGNEVFPRDEVVVKGGLQKPPEYYVDLLARDDPELASEIKRKRSDARVISESVGQRLRAREKCTRARVSTERRRYENG